MKIIFIPISITGYLLDSASERFRCRWLAPHLNADIYDRTQNLSDYDAIIYNKSYISEEMIALSERHKDKFQMLDMTDIWFPFHEDNLRRMAKNCRLLTASSADLAEELKKFGNAHYLPDRQNLDFYKARKVHINKPAILVWFGYVENFERIRPLLTYIEDKELPLLIISDRPPRYAKNPIFRGEFRKWSLETSNNDIISGDIVLNPLWKYKSNNKTTTAWALGMPVAENEKEIERFLNWEERRIEAKRRLKEAKEKWDIRTSAKELKNLIRRHI